MNNYSARKNRVNAYKQVNIDYTFIAKIDQLSAKEEEIKWHLLKNEEEIPLNETGREINFTFDDSFLGCIVRVSAYIKDEDKTKWAFDDDNVDTFIVVLSDLRNTEWKDAKDAVALFSAFAW